MHKAEKPKRNRPFDVREGVDGKFRTWILMRYSELGLLRHSSHFDHAVWVVTDVGSVRHDLVKAALEKLSSLPPL